MNARRQKTIRRSFTLTELLVVIMVIGILASTVLFAMYNAVQQAKESRTKAQIEKLHELLMQRWDSYRTRAIRLQGLPTAARRDANAMAVGRLWALRDLIRMELPDRQTDVVDDPVSYTLSYNGSGGPSSATVSVAAPACFREYRRRVTSLDKNTPKTLAGGAAEWAKSPEYQGAECLYMIIASIQDVNGNALDFLHEGEVGDRDEDGMSEILDAWGNPIEFLRWAPGYSSEIQKQDPQSSPDPFDPLRIYPNNYALYPFVYSAGPDGLYDINISAGLQYSTLTPPNDPYYVDPSNPDQPGATMDANGDGELSFMDNITNLGLGDW